MVHGVAVTEKLPGGKQPGGKLPAGKLPVRKNCQCGQLPVRKIGRKFYELILLILYLLSLSILFKMHKIFKRKQYLD